MLGVLSSHLLRMVINPSLCLAIHEGVPAGVTRGRFSRDVFALSTFFFRRQYVVFLISYNSKLLPYTEYFVYFEVYYNSSNTSFI